LAGSDGQLGVTAVIALTGWRLLQFDGR